MRSRRPCRSTKSMASSGTRSGSRPRSRTRPPAASAGTRGASARAASSTAAAGLCQRRRGDSRIARTRDARIAPSAPWPRPRAPDRRAWRIPPRSGCGRRRAGQAPDRDRARGLAEAVAARAPAARREPRKRQPAGEEEERTVERPLRVPILLQRPQVRHAEVVRDVARGSATPTASRTRAAAWPAPPARPAVLPAASRPAKRRAHRAAGATARGRSTNCALAHRSPAGTMSHSMRGRPVSARSRASSSSASPRKVTRCGRSTKRGSAAQAASASAERRRPPARRPDEPPRERARPRSPARTPS